MMYKNDLQVKKIKVRKVCIVVYYFHKCFYVCVNVVSWKQTQETGSAGFLQESELLNCWKGE